MNTIRLGNTGATVRECQRLLNERGYHLQPDGVFGAVTDAKVRLFQASENIAVDGIVGQNTWARLQASPGHATPGDALEAEKKRLLALVPLGAPTHVRAALATAIRDLGKKEIPDGSNAGPEIDHLVRFYNEYWWRLKPGVNVDAVHARGYPLASECIKPQAWCAMACMNWIRAALNLPYWGYQSGFMAPLPGHPCRYFFGNGGQVEKWAQEEGRWSGPLQADSMIPPGSIATIGGSSAGSDTADAEHVLLVICDNGDGTVTTIEGNVGNAVRSYVRKKTTLRGVACWW